MADKVRRCLACCLNLSLSSFSTTQLKKRGLRKCKSCTKQCASLTSLTAPDHPIDNVEAQMLVSEKDVGRDFGKADDDIEKIKRHTIEQSKLLKILIKSHKTTMLLAIRRLLNDAANVKDKSRFSDDAIKFLTKHSRNGRDDINPTLVGFPPLFRIREAIHSHSKPTVKRIFIELFTKAYQIPFEEEDDDDWLVHALTEVYL